jgi:lactoylglutathione lyase
MDLGKFSVSLAVKDINASLEFYKKMGFESIGGDLSGEKKWSILVNGSTKIGLFQGMFLENILTFNPTDLRTLQKQLRINGMRFEKEIEEHTDGPGHAILKDPDGNIVLLDQH